MQKEKGRRKEGQKGIQKDKRTGRQRAERQKGRKTKGQKKEGQKEEGQKKEGQKEEGQKKEGQKEEGQKEEGQKEEGQKEIMELFHKRETEGAGHAAGVDSELLAVLGAAVAASSSDEHIAVIAAALAAYEDDGARTNLHIQKINRAAGILPAWGIMGNREAIDRRRF